MLNFEGAKVLDPKLQSEALIKKLIVRNLKLGYEF